MDWLFEPQNIIALFTLTAIEIVLGIDNIIFISIFAGRLPEEQRSTARIAGLGLALLTRVLLLLALSWLMKLTAPLFVILANEISGRDLLLIGGGLFLLAKSTLEIHSSINPEEEDHQESGGKGRFWSTILQIGLIDIVFSLDSVITAVGMAKHIGVMILAVIIAVGIMMIASGPISRFVEEHPTFKVLALSFLVLIGVALIADGVNLHIPKGYIYFAMSFSLFVEMLNLRIRARRKPV